MLDGLSYISSSGIIYYYTSADSVLERYTKDLPKNVKNMLKYVNAHAFSCIIHVRKFDL